MDYQLYARGANFNAEKIKESMTTIGEVSDKSKEDLILSLINSFQIFINKDLEEFEFKDEQKLVIAEIEKKYNSDHWNCML